MRSIAVLILFTILLAVLSCAKQTAPTGGPKDTIPPVLVNSNPPSEALNVDTRTIELELSELVILANPKEQIIITPDIGKEFEITARKKKVVLNAGKNLQPNTTYTFNFRDAVQDITEKNPAVNLKLAFSTGTYIDSLSITGIVRNLLLNKEVKDATVALYESDTFNIFQHKPVYLTKTNEKGEFQFDNLKHGTFFIYAFEDRNRNLIVDSRNENYGFKSDPIELDASRNGINLNLVKLDARPLKLTSARPFNTYFNIRTTKGIKDYTIETTSPDSILSSYGEDRSNIRIYNTFENIDSIAVQFTATDSIQNTTDTTLYVKFVERKVTPEKFSFSLEQTKTIARNGQLEVRARTNKPIARLNTDSIFIAPDSTTRIPITRDDVKFETKTGHITIRKQLPKEYFTPQASPQNAQAPITGKPSASLPATLYFGKAALISVELDSTQHIEENLKPLREEDTGVIIAQVETTEPNYLVQLVTKTSDVIQSFTSRQKVSFNDLVPGEYYVRLVIDRNNDGEWTPGNFFRNQEPEPVVFYQNEKKNPAIILKANFELGPLLIRF